MSETKMQLGQAGANYPSSPLLKDKLPKDPFELAKKWLEEAYESAPSFIEPNTMALSTVSHDSKPSCREVLLKDLDHEGFTFFTNYESRKAQEIQNNPFVAASFYWPWLYWQLRIEGQAKKLSLEKSKKYFHSRPFSRQVSASISKQSQFLESRNKLLEEIEAETAKYPENKVPYTGKWGGFKIIPCRFEFWQGQPDRLHDRIVYNKDNLNWLIKRIYP